MKSTPSCLTVLGAEAEAIGDGVVETGETVVAVVVAAEETWSYPTAPPIVTPAAEAFEEVTLEVVVIEVAAAVGISEDVVAEAFEEATKAPESSSKWVSCHPPGMSQL